MAALSRDYRGARIARFGSSGTAVTIKEIGTVRDIPLTTYGQWRSNYHTVRVPIVLEEHDDKTGRS